jgi:nicotinamidase-related amidase
MGRREFQHDAQALSLIPELATAPEDHRVEKRTWGAFSNTDLAAYLQSRGVTQVVVTGVATCAGVESTARQAHELGLNVTIATDAVTDIVADTHETSIRYVFPRMAETGTAAEIVAALEGV